MTGFVEVADRVLAERLRVARDLAVASCCGAEQRQGVEVLWQFIAGSYGQTWAHATAIANAYGEGLRLAGEIDS